MNPFTSFCSPIQFPQPSEPKMSKTPLSIKKIQIYGNFDDSVTSLKETKISSQIISQQFMIKKRYRCTYSGINLSFFILFYPCLHTIFLGPKTIHLWYINPSIEREKGLSIIVINLFCFFLPKKKNFAKPYWAIWVLECDSFFLSRLNLPNKLFVIFSHLFRVLLGI